MGPKAYALTRRERILAVALALVLVFEAGRLSAESSALASVLHLVAPDKNGLIHTCYATSGGALRLVAPNQPCRTNENSLVWQQGDRFNHQYRDISLPANAQCGSSRFPGYCVLDTMTVPKQPLEISYMCKSAGGIWQYPGPVAGTNPVDFYCFGDLAIYYQRAVWLLHSTTVPLDQTRQIRYDAVFTSP